MFESIGDPLQEQVADMAPEAAVDLAQVHDVEGHHGRSAFRGGSRTQQRIQPLAEQDALRQPRQGIEIGQQLSGFLVLAVLQREGQTRHYVLQEQQFLIAQHAAFACCQRQHTESPAVDEQRHGDDGFVAGGHPVAAIRDGRLALLEIGAVGDLTEAQRPTEKTRVRLRAVAEREFEFPEVIAVWATQPVPRRSMATVLRDERENRELVATDLHGQPARFAQ